VKVVVRLAVSPLALIVVVSKPVNAFVYSSFTGGLCLKIKAASARCLSASGVTFAAEKQRTCPVVSRFFQVGSPVLSH